MRGAADYVSVVLEFFFISRGRTGKKKAQDSSGGGKPGEYEPDGIVFPVGIEDPSGDGRAGDAACHEEKAGDTENRPDVLYAEVFPEEGDPERSSAAGTDAVDGSEYGNHDEGRAVKEFKYQQGNGGHGGGESQDVFLGEHICHETVEQAGDQTDYRENGDGDSRTGACYADAGEIGHLVDGNGVHGYHLQHL